MVHLEGKQCVLAALAARQRRMEVVLVKYDLAATKAQDVLAAAAAANVPVRRVAGDELNALTHGRTHGGVVAVAGPKPRLTGDDLLARLADGRTPPLLVLLEGVDDARNLGFTIRTADAVGVTALLVKKHLWDFDEAEVARSSSGAIDRLPLVQFEDIGLLNEIKKHKVRVLGCLSGARRTVFDVNLSRGVMLCVGGEKRGLSGAARKVCDRFITIPTPGTGSLSLSHAGAIVLGEALRQRRAAATKTAEIRKISADTAMPRR